MAAYAAPASPRHPVVNECYENAVAITPADNTAIGPYQALYVGGAGNVVLIPYNSTTPVTFTGVPAGTILRVHFQGINATSTTATALVGLG
jgi:hypothetical protein